MMGTVNVDSSEHRDVLGRQCSDSVLTPNMTRAVVDSFEYK